MTEEKSLIIARIKGGQTEDAKFVVEMFEDNPRFKYPTLRLFDPSQLFTVGVDPNQLRLGDELYVRFRAWFVESDRLNKEGNAYKDVTRLEAIDNGQDGSPDKLDSILHLLRAIEEHLVSIRQSTEVIAVEAITPTRVVEAEPWRDYTPDPPMTDMEKDRLERALYHRDDDDGREGAETFEEALDGPEESGPVLSEDMARRRFGKLAGPAMRAGKLDRLTSGKLTSEVSAGAMNWRTALQQLEAAIAESEQV